MKKQLLALICLLSILRIEHASAVSYENDFSTTAFTTETNDVDWSVSSGAYQNIYTGDNTVSSASVAIAGINGTSFIMSSQFTINSITAPNSSLSTLGFGAMGLSSGFSATNASSAYYLADFAYAYEDNHYQAGRLRILSLGDTSNFSAIDTEDNFDNNTNRKAVLDGVTYTLKLTGTYNNSGHLDLSLGLFDSTGTTQYGTSATATDLTPLTGTNFGYRNRTASQSSGDASLNASFDNFSVATIPEPSTLALASIVIVSLLTFGRRRVK